MSAIEHFIFANPSHGHLWRIEIERTTNRYTVVWNHDEFSGRNHEVFGSNHVEYADGRVASGAWIKVCGRKAKRLVGR